MYNMYKSLMSLRAANSQLYRGWYCRHDDFMKMGYVPGSGFGIYAFTREQPNLETGFLILINVKNSEIRVDLAKAGQKEAKITCGNIMKKDADTVCSDNTLTLTGHGFVIATYSVKQQFAGWYQFEYKRTLEKQYQNCFVSRPVERRGDLEFKVKKNYWTGNDVTCKHQIEVDGSL